jgi:hypothetical protein
VRARMRSDQHGVALDGLERLLQDSVAWGGFYNTASFGVGIDDSGELYAGGSCHYPGPATAPDTESYLDYTDDFRSCCPSSDPIITVPCTIRATGFSTPGTRP